MAKCSPGALVYDASYHRARARGRASTRPFAPASMIAPMPRSRVPGPLLVAVSTLALAALLYPGALLRGEAFFERERAMREAMRYPPAEALVNVVVRDADLPRALTGARRIAAEVRRLGEARGVRVAGPAPAPLSRLRGESRAQFFAKGADRNALRAAVRDAVAAHPDLRRQITVDVDPQSVL